MDPLKILDEAKDLIGERGAVYGGIEKNFERAADIASLKLDRHISPYDVAIILDVDIAGDVPGIKPEESSIKIGNGPSLLAYDEMMIPNLKLRDLVIDTAKEINVPLQISAMEGGATDGAPIHLHKSGVPSVVLAVPTRHIHSHNAIMHRKDFDQAAKLLVEIIKRLDNATVTDLTSQQ